MAGGVGGGIAGMGFAGGGSYYKQGGSFMPGGNPLGGNPKKAEWLKQQAGAGQAGGPQMPYRPGAPRVQGMIDPLAEAGTGLLDPNSAYSQKMRQEALRGIGDQAGAQQRAAVLQAARAGYGTGAGAELLETQGEIGQAGLEAQGQTAAQLQLQGPQVGAQILNPALSAQMGLQSNDLQAWLAQQNLSQQQQAQQANLTLEQQRMKAQMEMERARFEQEARLRQLASMYAGYGG